MRFVAEDWIKQTLLFFWWPFCFLNGPDLLDPECSTIFFYHCYDHRTRRINGKQGGHWRLRVSENEEWHKWNNGAGSGYGYTKVRPQGSVNSGLDRFARELGRLKVIYP